MRPRAVFMSKIAFFVIFALVAVSANPRTASQEMQELGHFWAMGGTVQLLPGGNVLKKEDGAVTMYSYEHGKYGVNNQTNVALSLANWTYFDWQSVDWKDQINRNNSDIPDQKFWPQNAKVKKVLYLSPRNALVVTVLVCYSVKEAQTSYPILSTADQIWVAALRGTKTDTVYVYDKLWQRKLESQSNYGELAVQQVTGIGKILVLYSASTGGSSESEQLDIYRLNFD